MKSKQKEKMKRVKPIYAGILIFINLLFTACTTSPEQNNKAVPVEDRSITDTGYQDVTSDARVVVNGETAVESTLSDINHKESVSEQSNSPVALAFLKDADR
jgi:hypothetical protein